jgi:hypothetical protein
MTCLSSGSLLLLLLLGSVGSLAHTNNGTLVSRDWGCPVYGMNIQGNDIQHVDNVATWEDCGFLCQMIEGCQYWTWIIDRAAGDLVIIFIFILYITCIFIFLSLSHCYTVDLSVQYIG